MKMKIVLIMMLRFMTRYGIKYNTLLSERRNYFHVFVQVLFALNASGVVDLLLFIASNSNEQQYHLQVLEVRGTQRYCSYKQLQI